MKIIVITFFLLMSMNLYAEDLINDALVAFANGDYQKSKSAYTQACDEGNAKVVLG